jgi:hypothetical protein
MLIMGPFSYIRMSKNSIIAVVALLAVLAGGYLLMKKSGLFTGSGEPNTTSTLGGETSTSSNPTLTSSLQPAAPTVETERNTLPSNSTAIVSGRVTPNGASTEYWYEYGESQSLGSRISPQLIGSGFTSILAPGYVTGLKANTTYYFRLSAKNQYGTAHGATYSFRTNSNPPPQGSVPVGVTAAATNIGRESARLNGEVNPKGAEATYWFEYGDTTALGNVTSFQSAGHGTSIVKVSANLSGLRPLTKYYFRLNVQNQYGTFISTVLTFTTTGPSAPNQPTVTTTSATNVATSSATLNGRVNPNGASTTYWFEYSKDSLMGTIIGTVSPLPSLSGSSVVPVFATLTGLSRDTKYFYRIGAKNDYGTVKGSIVSFQTKR